MFTPAHNAAAATGKGSAHRRERLLGARHGSGRQGEVVRRRRDDDETWPELEATLYSYIWSDQNGLAYWVDTLAASLASCRAVGLDPYFA